MRTIFIIMILFCSVIICQGQKRNIGDTSLSKNVGYVLDGIYINKEEATKVKNILIREVWTKEMIYKNIYVQKELDSVVVLITKQYAIAQYQKKFSAFSKEYKKEIEWQMKYNHNDDDDGIFYLTTYGGVSDGNEKIRQLYNIPASKIKKVELHKKETCCGTNTSVFITMR